MNKEWLQKFSEEMMMTWVMPLTVVMKKNWQVKKVFKRLRLDGKLSQSEMRGRRY